MPRRDAALDDAEILRDLDHDFPHLLKDAEFDQVYPARIQRLSRCHWTPVGVCRKVAQFLAPHPDVRVLDLGCGPGKFCAIGASLTGASFTGVEQREKLVKAARRMLRRFRLKRANIIHGNITDIDFAAYNAFYLFNPFQENIFENFRIDTEVELSTALYNQYNTHVAAQLEKMPPGTRVVTYWGDNAEIPASYDCVESAQGATLKFWVKQGLAGK